MSWNFIRIALLKLNSNEIPSHIWRLFSPLASKEVDGFIFFDKHGLYEPGKATSQCLWLKPFMLEEVFDGFTVPKKLMNEKPADYTDFESFVDEVKSGSEKRMEKRVKKKKKNTEWFPTHDLNLPPLPPQPVQSTNRPQKQRYVQQWSYYGPGTERRGRGRGQNWGGGAATMGRGRGVTEGQIGQVGADGDRPFGKGAQTGYPYYGDQRDMYYPNQRFPDAAYNGKPKGRGILGKQFKDPFGMGEMESALGYYDYGSDQRQRQQRPLHKKY